MNFWKTSTEKARDTGMAMVLIFLIAAVFLDNHTLLIPAILLQLANMIWPPVFKPVAPLWFGLSHLLGAVVSRVILTVIFAVLVIPVGLIRRMIGKDPLLLKKWKKGKESVLSEREHAFSGDDLLRPF